MNNKKQTVRLNESQLKRVVAESVKNVISEAHGQKDRFRQSRLDNFNKRIYEVLVNLNNLEYLLEGLLYNNPDGSRDYKWLKRYGFYKSFNRLEEAYNLIKQAGYNISLVKRDVTGEYKETVKRSQEYSGYGENNSEQRDYSGYQDGEDNF